MSRLDIPTIERTRPDRAHEISDSTGRGQDWIRTPAAFGATFALFLVAMLFVVLATAFGTVRP